MRAIGHTKDAASQALPRGAARAAVRAASVPQPISHRVLANGLDHHVLEWTPSGAQLSVAVLLHGFQDGAASFDGVAPALAAVGLRVFAPDLRGFGQSARVPLGGYYHFPDYVFDVADLVDHLSPDAPIFLVGHSMGGTVAGLHASTFPGRVALLALLEGLGPPDFPSSGAVDRLHHWIDGVRRTRAREEKAMSLDEAARRLRTSHPSVDEAVLRTRASQLTRPVAEGSEQRVWRFDPLHRTTSPIGFSSSRWMAHGARIAAPTLVVSGGPTGFHPDDEEARIAVIPHVRRAEIADAGHMMHWTRPEQLSALLIDFVRENMV